MKKEKLRFHVLMDRLGVMPSVIGDVVRERGNTKSSRRTMMNSVAQWQNFDIRRRPPQVVWDFLEEARERQLQEMDTIISQAIESRDKKGITTVRIPYYTRQEDYDTLYDDGYDWRMANATLRLAAEMLENSGFVVEFVFADELLTEKLRHT